jgi:hypothetical protein
LKTRWLNPPVPDIGAVTRFLKNRPNDRGGSLLDLFYNPVQRADNWFRCDWKAYEPSGLGKNTLNEH